MRRAGLDLASFPFALAIQTCGLKYRVGLALRCRIPLSERNLEILSRRPALEWPASCHTYHVPTRHW